jgi:hypothetical protein
MFHVRKVLGPIATPDHIHWAPGLPKTRSGKIMRRILRKITTDQTSPEHLGGTSLQFLSSCWLNGHCVLIWLRSRSVQISQPSPIQEW